MSIRRFSVATLALLAAFLVLPNAAFAKDEWLQVRSKNFFLIGNAPEKDIRKVATRLEQFRETFRQLFTKTRLDSPIPTNVVVFKSDSAYKPFKPVRADGKADNFIAGYFMPGEDVNYITLSVEGEDADTFGTIFHEYVHSIVKMNFGESEIPPWFNEGLAEYYQTFQIEKDQEAKLGLAQVNHLRLLQESKLIPLETLFKISNYALHQNGDHSRSIFYAESWALIHYLLINGKSAALNAFLNSLMKDVPAEKAFTDAFQTTYAQMEKDLRKYVGLSSYKYTITTFKEKLVFDSEMRASPLAEPETNAYLGDLLFHTNRTDDAEPFLQKTLASTPNSSMANTTMGMVRFRQKKYEDAKTYLEKAIAGDQKNHLALYRYAYILSRDGRDEYGFVRSFPKESTVKMRDLLKRAIAVSPSFTESYELYAFISLVNNEEMDEAVLYLQKALKYQPGNQRYALRIADIKARQEKFSEAAAIAQKIAKTTSDPDIKSNAENLMNRLNDYQAKKSEFEAAKAAYEKAGGPPVMRRPVVEKEPTEEEIMQRAAEENLVSVNQALRKPAAGEARVLGHIMSISCANQPISYTVKTDTETFKLTSVDFQGLTLNTFDGAMDGSIQVGCDAKVADALAVLTYKPKTDTKKISRGEMVAIEFVPKSFRVMDEKEIGETLARLDAPTEVSVTTNSPGTIIRTTSEPDPQQRRDAMAAAIRAALSKPGAGEKQVQGFIDHAECSNKGTFFFFKAESQVIKLSVASPQSLKVRGFTPDIERVQLGCTMKNVDVAAIVTYKEAPDAKAKTNGELIALDFVPTSFVLGN